MKRIRRSVYGVLAGMIMMTNTAYAMPNVTWGELPHTNLQSVMLTDGENVFNRYNRQYCQR